jgi:hypothetical protein
VALDLPQSGSLFVVFRKTGRSAGSQFVRLEHEGVTVADARSPHAAESGPQVVSASYGDPSNPARRKDVTEQVRQDLARGAAVIRANNDWAGGDPALRTVKRLFVVLRLPDGHEKNVEAEEGQPLSLMEPATPTRLPCEILGENQGLLAWEPGTFRATKADGTTSTWETRAPRSVLLEGPWTLAFPAGWGAPERVRVEKLMSWTALDLSPEARAFSGTATYTAEFSMSPLAAGAKVELDLGRVEVIASVQVNGERAGSLWSPPYRLDITRLVKPGLNRLSVAVTSTWFNRLAYDAGLEERARKTWTISGPAKGRPPVPAGLLGPVTVRVGQALGVGEVR